MVGVAQWRALAPGVIVVAELDPLAQWRMTRAPQLEQGSGPRVAERVLLQLHECRSRTVIRLRNLEAETVRFVLHVAGQRELCGLDRQREHAGDEEQQGQRRHV